MRQLEDARADGPQADPSALAFRGRPTPARTLTPPVSTASFGHCRSLLIAARDRSAATRITG
jgi:hypothetical protein